MTKDSVLVFRVSDHHTLVRDSVIGEATLKLADVVAAYDGKKSSTHTLPLTQPANNVVTASKGMMYFDVLLVLGFLNNLLLSLSLLTWISTF